jgi:transcriptional regulator with XRE-family HTH domain
MRTITEVLDAIKEKNGIRSDYKLAMFLGVGDGSLRNYRHGRSLPDEPTCVKFAEALGEDPALLVVEMQAQRAKTPDAQKLWEHVAALLASGKTAAVNLSVALACAVVILATEGALFSNEAAAMSADSGLYIMSNHRRRFGTGSDTSIPIVARLRVATQPIRA